MYSDESASFPGIFVLFWRRAWQYAYSTTWFFLFKSIAFETPYLKKYLFVLFEKKASLVWIYFKILSLQFDSPSNHTCIMVFWNFFELSLVDYVCFMHIIYSYLLRVFCTLVHCTTSSDVLQLNNVTTTSYGNIYFKIHGVDFSHRVKADFHWEYFCLQMKKTKEKILAERKTTTFFWVRERKNL